MIVDINGIICTRLTPEALLILHRSLIQDLYIVVMIQASTQVSSPVFVFNFSTVLHSLLMKFLILSRFMTVVQIARHWTQWQPRESSQDTPFYFTIHFNIIFHPQLSLPSVFFPPGLLLNVLYAVIISFIQAYATSTSHVILDFIILAIFGEQYKLRSCPLLILLEFVERFRVALFSLGYRILIWTDLNRTVSSHEMWLLLSKLFTMFCIQTHLQCG